METCIKHSSYYLRTRIIFATEYTLLDEVSVRLQDRISTIGKLLNFWIPIAEIDPFFDYGLIDKRWVGRIGLKTSGVW